MDTTEAEVKKIVGLLAASVEKCTRGGWLAFPEFEDESSALSYVDRVLFLPVGSRVWLNFKGGRPRQAVLGGKLQDGTKAVLWLFDQEHGVGHAEVPLDAIYLDEPAYIPEETPKEEPAADEPTAAAEL